MELVRKPFQGVLNIVKFNWHFYLAAFVVIGLAVMLRNKLPSNFQLLFLTGCFVAMITVLSSLIVSYYIYDRSDLYSLPWLKELKNRSPTKILNISAGFDETSNYLANFFSDAQLIVSDFYNPQKHTELSIERARKMYPSHPNTIQVATNKLPFRKGEFDLINLFMAAHEVRNQEERIIFFKELSRVTSKKGRLIVTEHLRDVNNFLAFNFGFFHFYSKASWVDLFDKANFELIKEVKTTPFVTTFILRHYGTTH